MIMEDTRIWKKIQYYYQPRQLDIFNHSNKKILIKGLLRSQTESTFIDYHRKQYYGLQKYDITQLKCTYIHLII